MYHIVAYQRNHLGKNGKNPHPVFSLTLKIYKGRLEMKPNTLIIILSAFLFSTLAHANPLKVSTANPRYFVDSHGQAVVLVGSHTWTNFQDVGDTDPPQAFNWVEYLNFLQANNHNFFRLWTWEEAKWATFTTNDVWLSPLPFNRPGPGTALDGKPKLDLSSLNQSYFDRLRQRVIDAGARGIYVSIMLFNGFSVETKGYTGNPWPGHPFNKSNNVNNISGDPNSDNNGNEIHRLQIPSVTTIQEIYVKKVIDTVNDLDNVLYEICNECNPQSIAFQGQMVDYIKNYERTKPKQHPVGMTVAYPSGNNSDLFASKADWISPNSSGGYDTNPPASNGSKVVISDTDHIWGIGGDRYWAWKSFTRGLNILFMDEYDFWGADINNPTWVDVRKNLGYIKSYADRIALIAMVPSGSLASTGYCLASKYEYVVYAPSGGSLTVNLKNTPDDVVVEWFRPSNGQATSGGVVTGGSTRSFTPPFSGDAVLYLRSSAAPPNTLPSAPKNLRIVP